MTKELPLLDRLRQMEGEGYMFAKLCREEIQQLRGNLSLAEEGLANAMQEIQRKDAALTETHDAWTAETEKRVGLEREVARLRRGLDRCRLASGLTKAEIIDAALAGASDEPLAGRILQLNEQDCSKLDLDLTWEGAYKRIAAPVKQSQFGDVQREQFKSTSLSEEIEDAQRTVVQMPDDLKRSLGLKSGEPLNAEGWMCQCGRFNYSYTEPCDCEHGPPSRTNV